MFPPTFCCITSLRVSNPGFHFPPKPNLSVASFNCPWVFPPKRHPLPFLPLFFGGHHLNCQGFSFLFFVKMGVP